MSIYTQLYEFAAGLGAFEGYVYLKEAANPKYLPKWADNLARGYRALSEELREEIQPLVDGTAGRALKSILPFLGEEHEVVQSLRSMIKGELPASPDDFNRPKIS